MLIVFDSRTNYQKIDYDGDSFVKGDYSVHTIDVLMKHDTEYDTYTYTGSLQFKRSDGQTSPKLVMTPKKIEYGGKVYNGYTYKMEGDWFTEIAGVLKMSVSISTYNEGGTGASTNKAYANIEINVEDSVVETMPTTITNEEYTALMNVVNSKLNKGDETIYRLTNLFGTTQKFAEECIAKLTEIQTIKIFLGFVADDDGTLDSTIGLVGDKNSSVLVISGKGDIEKYKNGELQVISMPYLYTDEIEIGNAFVDLLKVSGDLDIKDAYIIAKEPENDNDLVTKKYVDSQTSLGYSKTETDNLLLNKANKSDVYEKNETYSKTETDKKIADLVNSAPETLDTLGELAEGIKENQDIIATLNNAISNKANITEVYTKQEANALLDNKANTSTTYSKTEVDNLLKNIDVYTKIQTDNLLLTKADIEDVYTKDDVYSKTEVDNKFSNQELSNYYNKEEINQIVNNNFNVTVKADGSSTSDSLSKITAENYRNTCVYLTEEATGLTYILSFDKALEQEENIVYYWINEKYTYVIVLDKNGYDNSLYYMLNETDYYTKIETDAKLNQKANLTDTYTRKQIDELLGGENGKVNLSNYYTKEETEKISGGYEINPQNDGNYISLTKELIYNNKIQKSYVTFDNYKFVCRFIGFIKDTENTTYIWQSLNLKFTMTFTNTDLSFVRQKREDLSYLTASETYEAIGRKANKDDVYTKIETNELLNQKANRSDVYSKEEVYGKHETYSKTQIESLLSGGNGEVNLSNYYTKTETNNLIAENKEIVEFTEKLGFPAGETNKLYVAGDTLKIYTWSGSSYIQLYATDFNAKANVADVYSKVVMDDLLKTKISTTQKGQANGVAELDANGKVPTSQLPSYVDDVLEFSSKSVFPTTGESGKIYVALDTNITYRWGGTEYVEISSSLALGETSSTAYSGDKGKANADAITALQNNKANASDVYLRETVNDLLATKADLSNTYTKNEVDTIVGNINTILDTLNGEVI